MRGFGLLILASIVAGGPVRAQATPEAAAEAFGGAIRRADYAGAARLMHPSALRSLRELFRPLVSAPDGGELLGQLFGVSSPRELAAISDTVMFARFLKTVMGQQEGLAETLRSARFEALGHVTGKGDTALVVSRTTMTVEGVSVSTFEVMPFVRDGGRYWGLLKADFTNMAAMLRARLSKPA